MKRRTCLSIRTRRTVRIDELSIRCPECGAEVLVAEAAAKKQMIPAAQDDKASANALMDPANLVPCDHVISAAIDETED